MRRGYCERAFKENVGEEVREEGKGGGQGRGVRGEGMIWNGRGKEERSAYKIHALIIYKEQNTSRPLSNQFSLNT